MMADPRAVGSLVGDFAAQWRTAAGPGSGRAIRIVYPDFDVSLLDGLQARDGVVHREHPARGWPRSPNCCAPTTPSSTNGSLATTGFLESTDRDSSYISSQSRSTRRTARAGRHARGHVLSRSNLARAAGKVAARQHLRHLCAAAHPPLNTSLTEVKPGTVPPTIRERLAQHRTEPDVRQLPRRDRSARLRAGELRRDRRMAHDRRVRQAGRCRRSDRERRVE